MTNDLNKCSLRLYEAEKYASENNPYEAIKRLVVAFAHLLREVVKEDQELNHVIGELDELLKRTKNANWHPR
ncbi:MAG: hypothetical protein HOI47_14540 [Candidatus Scalindua sp.]|jgi:hypothetical protein|nr:hypothetical protein [archaeon]MBT4532156.1 hypothetical protein [archaeon]MBT6227860.1 hypothetical protein [Candidatus Scalindua sp.]